MRAATVGYVAAAGAPLLTVPSLGGGDAMDDTSVHFLLEMALLSPEEVEQLRKAERRKLAREEKARKEKERKEKEMQEMIARLTGEYPQGLPPALILLVSEEKEKEEEEEAPEVTSSSSLLQFLRQSRLRRGAEADPHGLLRLRFPGTMWRSMSC